MSNSANEPYEPPEIVAYTEEDLMEELGGADMDFF